jgi:hypothetical protein
MVLNCVLLNFKCSDECKGGLAWKDHSYYYTIYRPFVVEYGGMKYLVFSNPGFSGRVDIMEQGFGGQRSLADVDSESPSRSHKTKQLLEQAKVLKLSYPLGLPSGYQVHGEIEEDVIEKTVLFFLKKTVLFFL